MVLSGILVVVVVLVPVPVLVIVVTVLIVVVVEVFVVVTHVDCPSFSVFGSRLLVQSHPPRAEQDSVCVRWRPMPVPQPVLTVVHCSG